MAKHIRIDAEKIINSLRAGHTKTLEELYTAYRTDFFRWAGCRFHATNPDFEDAWQESVLAFYEQVQSGKLTTFRHSVRTWLFAVGYKRLLNYHRKTKRIFWRDAVDESMAKDVQLLDFEWDEPTSDEWALVEQAMQSISLQCREILVKRFYEGIKIPEIKTLLGHNSENTTSATLSRCLKKLKETVLGMINDK